MKSLVRYCSCSLALGLLFAIVSPTSLSCQSKESKTEALVKESDVIVVGKVGQLVSEWTPNRDKIQTRVTVSVDQAIKGTTPGNSITLVNLGGEVDGVGEWYSHTARFKKDEDVVIFAKKDNSGLFRVTGGEGGKFSVQKDAKTGAKIISNLGTVEAFTSKLKSIATSQSSDSHQK